MRPAMVLAQDISIRSLAFSLGPSVKVDYLAGAMLYLALKGGKKNIWENAELKHVK